MTNDVSLMREPANHVDRQRDDADPAPRRDEDDRGKPPGNAQPIRSSMMMNLVTAAVVALIGGVIGAMGYSHFVGPKAGEPSSSQSKTEGGSNKESSGMRGSGTDPATRSSTQASTSPSVAGISSSSEANELKEQIRNLNLKIDRLGEDVDRLQQLLSLAVPLLQRIAPKN